MSTVTVGFFPREQYCIAAEALQSIFDCTSIPFNLIIVDCNIPKRDRQQMEKVFTGHSNVKVIHTGRHLLPNQCRNLVIREAKDDFLCLTENDVIVGNGWLSCLLAEIEEHSADVVAPLVMEGRPGADKVHFDEGLGHVRSVQTPDGQKLDIFPRQNPKELDIGATSRSEEFVETHCLLFRRNVFQRIGLFDEELNASEEVDLSLALYHERVPVLFAPKCVVRYIPTTYPVRTEDREHFSMKWDIERASKSHDRIKSKWNLVRNPQLLGFVEERNLRGSGMLHRWRDEIATLISPEQSLILVDMELWSGSEIVSGLRTIPFLERDGQYWGPPADDDTAISELERLRQTGLRFIVFSWYAFWWFNYYSKFHSYLRSKYRCLLENSHLVIFDLERKP